MVRTLVSGERVERRTATWDGRDRHGNRAPTGIYFVTLRAGSESRIAKLADRRSISETFQGSMPVGSNAHPRPETGTVYVAPSKDSEHAIAEVLQDLLGIDRVGMLDRFIDLGGHSLMSLQVLELIEERFGVRVSPRDVMVESVGRLAAVCEEQVRSRRSEAT